MNAKTCRQNDQFARVHFDDTWSTAATTTASSGNSSKRSMSVFGRHRTVIDHVVRLPQLFMALAK
jgi:hypothetical protein